MCHGNASGVGRESQILVCWERELWHTETVSLAGEGYLKDSQVQIMMSYYARQGWIWNWPKSKASCQGIGVFWSCVLLPLLTCGPGWSHPLPWRQLPTRCAWLPNVNVFVRWGGGSSSPQILSSVHGTTIYHSQASYIHPSTSLVPNNQSIFFSTSQMSLKYFYFYPFRSWHLVPQLSNNLFPGTPASKEIIILT